MTKLKAIFVFLLLMLWAGEICPAPSQAGEGDTESQCVSCHTSAKKLIDITRTTATTTASNAPEVKGEG